MNAHRLAEERSLAYHAAIAERLRMHPELLADARQRVDTWLSVPSSPPYHACLWRDVLARDLSSILAFLTERSETACELRQSSPFAGILLPRERWHIWRTTRERLCTAIRSAFRDAAD
jgi:hypothetical protein